MYKIIHNNKVVDVVRVPSFIRFLKSGHVTITDRASAQGILGSDQQTVYSFKQVSRKDAIIASIEKITSKEFSGLKCLLNSSLMANADELALDAAKRIVIENLSATCKIKITDGFSVKLSDRKHYSFKLTTEDQLNLLSLENQLNSGAKTFVYHATGQLCKCFTRNDMVKIINMFKSFTLYHTTYFNVAKQYINSLTSIEQIVNFTYGTDVSEFVNDTAIKQILKNGGNF